MKFIFHLSIVIFILLSLWQACVSFFALPAYILPSPWQVLAALYQHYPLITSHTIPTLVEILGGFILGILSGCLLAMSMTVFKPLSRWCFPLLIMSQAIPFFAFAPLLVIWLG